MGDAVYDGVHEPLGRTAEPSLDEEELAAAAGTDQVGEERGIDGAHQLTPSVSQVWMAVGVFSGGSISTESPTSGASPSSRRVMLPRWM